MANSLGQRPSRRTVRIMTTTYHVRWSTNPSGSFHGQVTEFPGVAAEAQDLKELGNLLREGVARVAPPGQNFVLQISGGDGQSGQG